MKETEIQPNRIIYNSLMDLAVKLENMKKALYFIEKMQEDKISPDGFTYSIILHGLKINKSSNSLVRSSLENIKKVVQAGEFKLDEVFFNSILDVCCRYEFYDYLNFFHGI